MSTTYYVRSDHYIDGMTESEVSEVALSDHELHGMYDEWLDEAYGPLTIAGVEGYEVSRVLRDTDPTAYRVGFSDWLDSECGEDEPLMELSF